MTKPAESFMCCSLPDDGVALKVWITLFSVQPLCSLCLGGCCNSDSYNHRDTENTEVAQRNPRTRTFCAKLKALTIKICFVWEHICFEIYDIAFEVF